ncbi:PAK4-inhibitor INKA2 [Trichomycterus rosablanca]|uniref:PAK4-inhibitor INKA2 n=1 Tax=Trichomycterus rosablanca TaxID=2290929 RepID=UPI002F35FAE9
MDRATERKEMDTCLKRLKQELTSMKEAGDGLQTQMNSMMGALQELKLLKMQTALEQLQISCKTSQNQHFHQSPHISTSSDKFQLEHISKESRPMDTKKSEKPKNITRESSLSHLEVKPTMFLTSSPIKKHSLVPHYVPRRHDPRGTHHRGSLSNSASFSSCEDDSFSSRDGIRMCDTPSGLASRSSFEEHPASFNSPTITDLQGFMDTLSREGPSIDSDFSQYDTDDSSDWTSSLMSNSRNRQPLVLGDSVLADLVGNWLDLPDMENQTSGEEESSGRLSEASQHSLRLSCSQEFCRRINLTTSIFKKVLRSVRPDREKLLKERSAWQEDDEETLFKRSKNKNKGSKTKGGFYRPFWMKGSGLKGKNRPKSENESLKGPIFDYNSAVWV